jgi:hypothetical protein
MPAASAGGARHTALGGTAMMKRGIAGLAFASATAVALAFGATQAFAAPAVAEAVGARACTNQYCRAVACYPFYGYCNYARGICVCAG